MMKNSFLITSFIALSVLVLSVRAFPGNIKYKIGNEKEITLKRFFYPVMPGKTVELDVESDNIDNLSISVTNGNAIPESSGKWIIKAPSKSGEYELTIADNTSGQSAIITIFVLVPASKMKGEYLNGYRIGIYPEKYKGRDNYKKPDGFIEVTEKNKDIYITPHFQLKQFLCKQSSGWPKYILLNPKLLLKLEYLVGELHKEGINVSTLFIMSGYRTPYYNKSIGNVKFSRHVFGDAADIYIDNDNDGIIDDLNYDGKHTMADAEVIAKIIRQMDNTPGNKELIGGMGKYKKNSAHTYFIHVDTRGYKARW